MLRIYASKTKVSPDFTMNEIRTAVHELKTGKCIDPLGLIREVFNHSGEGFCKHYWIWQMILISQRLFLWSGIICGLKYLRRIKGLLRNLIIM